MLTLSALAERHALPAGATTALQTLLEALAAEAAPTAVHDPAEGLAVHIADSLAGLEVPALREADLIADLGAGPGLPGLVLATALPRAHVVLVESVGRKCAFIRETAAAMGLQSVEVVDTRIEAWAEGRERCDAVCARALAALPVLCEYAAPLLRPGGVLVAWKGHVDEDEAADARAAAAHLGLAPERVLPVTPYPGSSQRTLHIVRKVGPTPERYPRRPGLATKRPLSARRFT